MLLRSALALVLVAASGTGGVAAQPGPASTLPQIATHDNLKPAGRLEQGLLVLRLWAGSGQWHPEGPESASRRVEAFGEEGGPLSIPAPLIRVPAGTEVQVSVRNTLSSPLHVRGFCERPRPCEPLTVPPGATREVRFTLVAPGTFHYWAATGSPTLTSRDGDDSQLGGAIVAEAPGEIGDRVFVLGLKQERTGDTETELTVINGRSWPNTERLAYAVGQVVRWRVVNLTSVAHAMHLHGFYFLVGSVGDGVVDTRYGEPERRLAVTEQMPPGRAITLTWVPERAGNWLFHCHMLTHMTPPDSHHGGPVDTPVTDGASGMAGLVMGIHVTGASPASVASGAAPRPIRLIVAADTRHGAIPSFKVDLVTGSHPPPRLSDRAVPGPVMVLTRGEPVAVEIVNRLSEPTAIHWHGIELESYDDGVPGFGGTAGSVTPPVEPGGTFTARFTPSRAGTFIYHTHWHNAAQLAAGLYGPLLVLEPGQAFDPATDHVVVLGLDGAYLPAPDEPFVVNGEPRPRPLDLAAGVVNRLRFINITADNVALTVQLLSGFEPIQWTLVGKDGADARPPHRTSKPARQLVSVGETYDFEIAPMVPQPVGLWMELRRGNGELLLQWPVRVR